MLTDLEWLDLARRQSARFWRKVDKSGSCWPWTCGTCKDGYGKFAITAPRGHAPKQKHVRAHRLAWEMVNGPAPMGLVVMHSCDNPACVNPDHLRIGTQADNRADCIAKGRNPCGDAHWTVRMPGAMPRGENHWMRRQPWRKTHFGSAHSLAIINEDTAREIVRLLRAGHGPSAVASELGVSIHVAQDISRGRTWRHVTDSVAVESSERERQPVGAEREDDRQRSLFEVGT